MNAVYSRQHTPVSYTHLDEYKRQELVTSPLRRVLTIELSRFYNGIVRRKCFQRGWGSPRRCINRRGFKSPVNRILNFGKVRRRFADGTGHHQNDEVADTISGRSKRCAPCQTLMSLLDSHSLCRASVDPASRDVHLRQLNRRPNLPDSYGSGCLLYTSRCV